MHTVRSHWPALNVISGWTDIVVVCNGEVKGACRGELPVLGGAAAMLRDYLRHLSGRMSARSRVFAKPHSPVAQYRTPTPMNQNSQGN